MIKAILACDETGGVSKDGTLPWPKNSKDLKWFKENTNGHIVVMGSTTWKDPHMPCPLPNRMNVVATSNPDCCPEAHGIVDGDLVIDVKEVETTFPSLITWVIGGPNIIEQTLSIIDEFYISRIPGKYDCDTFLPLKKIETLFHRTYEEKHDEVTFEIWTKRP